MAVDGCTAPLSCTHLLAGTHLVACTQPLACTHLDTLCTHLPHPTERLPPAYASRRQAVLCNDCGLTGDAPFHFV